MRIGVLALVGLMTALVSCTARTAGIPEIAPIHSQVPEYDQSRTQDYEWVVVLFDDTTEEFDEGVMDLLLETESTADEALQHAGLGFLDGNDIGGHQYELYFAGLDREAMWKVLEPIFQRAPVPWTRVELRTEIGDPAPKVITR